MAKAKKVFFCTECGYEAAKWLGQCPACGSWNAFSEELVTTTGSKAKSTTSPSKPVTIDQVKSGDHSRMQTGISELDRVLGGGIVKGSLILVGGDPGIGKSTLMLQICQKLGQDGHSLLYVSGEESLHQIKLRGNRLGVDSRNLKLCTQRDIAQIEELVRQQKPTILLIDSIQTMVAEEVSSLPGSVSQVREVTARLMQLAKQQEIATFIVGHVTKDGNIAGPRVLEHMVDTVLYFEGDKNAAYRILKSVKNRFGSTNEIGIFEMKKEGLIEVLNPSEYMLSGRPLEEAGSLVVCAIEGSRPLFVEVQALTAYSTFNMPRRTVTGTDYNRVMMLIAVIEKKYGLSLVDNDCYVNIAGGIKLIEPSLDLGIGAAIISSITNKVVPHDMVIMGELGLTGEVRGITFANLRIREAIKLGFQKIIIPKINLSGMEEMEEYDRTKVDIIGLEHISQLKRYVF